MSIEHWAELSHLLPRRRGEHFGGEPNFEMIFIFFKSCEWLLVDFRTAIYVTGRTFLVTLFWKINLLFSFSYFEQNFCDNFSKMLSAILSELTSMCPEKQIEKTNVFWKFRLFLSFPHFAQYPKITFDKSDSGKPVKNAFYSSRETF